MAAPAKKTAKKAQEPEALPRRPAAEVFAPVMPPGTADSPHSPEGEAPAASSDRHARLRHTLRRLAHEPPQVLLLEGGTVEERTALSLWWAALLNCEQRPGAPSATHKAGEPQAEHGSLIPGMAASVPEIPTAPCAVCPACNQIANLEFLDLFFFDGREASIKIDDVRGLRATLAEAPRNDGLRVAIFAEAQALGIEAANALLKSLEEPQAATCFVLTAPQRERLLPTLVSRSFTITLPWPPARRAATGEASAWIAALAGFLSDGRGWMERTEKRGSLTPPLAQEICLELQKALAAAILNEPASHGSQLAAKLAALTPQNQRRCAEAISQAQDALAYTVNPALTLDWLATRLFLISRAKR